VSSFFSDFGRIWYLGELKKKKKCKEHFKQETLKLGFKQISWTEVKKSSREELANQLIQQYEDQQAWNLTLRIFHRMSRQDLCDKVQRERAEHRKIYRGNWAVVTYHSLVRSTGHQKSDCSRRCLAGPGWGFESTTLGVHGWCLSRLSYRSRAGKVTFLMKLVLGWAEGSLYQDRFLYLFYFCQEPRQLKETSLANLISRNWPSPAPITEIMSHPETFLFFIYSFEELKCDLSEPESDLCSDWMKQQLVWALMRGLLRKKMLLEASLLITVTPVCLAQLVCPELITGFSEGKIELYSRHLFPSRNGTVEAFYLRENTGVFHVPPPPLICWVGTCTKQVMEKGRDVAPICRHLTSLYASFILNLFTCKDACRPSLQSQVQLRGLCSLAVEGMWTNTFEFNDKALRRNGIADSDVPALLDTNIFLKCTESSYTFVHTSVQEFCAAMFYLLRCDHPNPAVRCREMLLADHLEKVNKACWIYWGKFSFWFKKVDTVFCFQPSQEIRQQFHQILKNLGEREGLRQTDFLALFCCLFEMENKAFVREAVNFLQDINFSINSDLDLVICAYCLKDCSGLRRLSFSVSNVTEKSSHNVIPWHHIFSVFTTNEHLKELEITNTDSANILCNQLRHPTGPLEKLQLNRVSLAGGSSVFLEVLSHSSDLKDLNLHNVNLSRDDTEMFCKVLSSSMCNTEELVLSGCFLRNPCWDLLCEALLSKKSLALDLSASNLHNKGLNVLCAALRHPDCCLRSLGLANCSFTAVDCPDLASVLTSNQKLTSLQIGLNKIGDVGVKVLCEALTHPNCHLEILGLRDCGLTGACRDLYSALSNSGTLRMLDLTINTLDHRGAVLCEALRYPGCPLWVLGLPKTRVDEETQMLLTVVEERNPYLTIIGIW
uniref:Pyrin domain-containing protein n=1 Tax=Otolemur garnettii TaxID=30611 RepID=H0XXF1_OTOGA